MSEFSVGVALGVMFALSSGTQILVAQAFGAKNFNALIRAYGCGLLINLIFASLSILLLLVFQHRYFRR